jgi:hypothetical protein
MGKWGISVCKWMAIPIAALLFSSLNALAQKSSQLPEIRPQANVDETYFLVRVLESLYEQWPNDVVSPNEFVSAAIDLRKEALRYRAHIKTKELDRNLGARFDELIESLDAYTAFLSNIDAIKKDAAKQLEKDTLSSGYTGGYAGGTALATLSRSDGVSTKEAVGAALVVGGITYLVDAWEKSGKREEAEKRAVESEARRISDNIQTSLFRAQATVRELARKRNWNTKEIGWELSDEQAALVASYQKSGDVLGLLKLLDRASDLRPRDPFPRISKNTLIALSFNNDVALLSRSSKDTYSAASLVPSDTVYDDYRSEYVTLAAIFMSAARAAEITNGVAGYDSTEISKAAANLWRKSLELSPTDSSGEIRAALSGALMADNSLHEARTIADSVVSMRKSDPEFCYHYARLLSRCEDATASLEWLSYAIKIGFSNIAWARKDPDFRFLREKSGEAFSELLSPKYDWRVTDDWMWDDVILKNTSDFPLTRIIFSVTLKKGTTPTKAAYQKTLQLKCDYLAPGKSKTWADVVDGAEGTWDLNSTASLRSDQNE